MGSQPKAPFHNNQYGASLGGPIIKDRPFFYVDYEGQQETVGVVTLGCVSTASGPGGSLSPADATNPVIANLLAAHNPWPAPNIRGQLEAYFKVKSNKGAAAMIRRSPLLTKSLP